VPGKKEKNEGAVKGWGCYLEKGKLKGAGKNILEGAFTFHQKKKAIWYGI